MDGKMDGMLDQNRQDTQTDDRQEEEKIDRRKA